MNNFKGLMNDAKKKKKIAMDLVKKTIYTQNRINILKTITKPFMM